MRSRKNSLCSTSRGDSRNSGNCYVQVLTPAPAYPHTPHKIIPITTDNDSIHDARSRKRTTKNEEGSNDLRTYSIEERGDQDRRVSLEFRFIYTGIRVKDMDESLRFYTEVLGMVIVEPLQKTTPTKGSVVTLKSANSEQLLELNHYEEGSPFNSPYVNGEDLDHIAFDVEDLEATMKELKQKGIEVVVEPYKIGREIGWKEAYVKDPNGIWIEFLERKSSKPEEP